MPESGVLIQDREKTASTGESRSALSIYLNEVRGHKLLSAGEEQEASITKNYEKLVLGNLRLVVSIANDYANRGLKLEDLVAHGNIGLIIAAEKFDLSRGCKFSTFAEWWIRSKILEAVYKHFKLIYLPRNVARNIYRLDKAIEEFFLKNGRKPDEPEICRLLNISKEKFKELESAINCDHILSLDEPINGDVTKGTLSDYLADKNETAETKAELKVTNNELWSMIQELNEKEKDVIVRNFGLNNCRKEETLVAIGLSYGVTRERIRQVRDKAIKKLKIKAKKRGMQV